MKKSKCAKEGCYPETGCSGLGLEDVRTCKHWKKVNTIELETIDKEIHESGFRMPWTSNTLGINNLNIIKYKKQSCWILLFSLP